MKQLLALLLSLCAIQTTQAVDASGSVAEINKIGHWKVIEFAGSRQIIYRISSYSINSATENIVFDFVPSRNCKPTPAVLISQLDSYNADFDNGYLPLDYKLPHQNPVPELINTVMSKGDTFAFFPFNSLTAEKILKCRDKGNLAIWVPASGDAAASRSGNTYFALDGFSQAYKTAMSSCEANR